MTRRARPSPRGCAGARSTILATSSPSEPAAGRPWRFDWRPTEPSGRQAGGRPTRSPRRVGGGASRQQAETVLRAAHQTTVALGALPLQREVELLAQRGRLRLQEPLDTTAAPTAASLPAAHLGLTKREAEVLALVAEGRTNRQIGQALFITPKTASVHVSRILAKLGVAGRGKQPRSPIGLGSTSTGRQGWGELRRLCCASFRRLSQG